jgi:hypothetical protein
MSHAPADEYRARLSARRAAHHALSRSDEQLSYARLAIFATGAGIAFAAWRGWLPAWWIALPAVAFLILIVRHDRIVRARDGAARAIALYERGLARIEDRWADAGDDGGRFSDAHHLYATDLDLFGPASLFQLLSTARTRAGEETLAAWLLAPATVPEVRERQAAVADLTSRLDLREGLWLAGTDVSAGVHTEALVAWAEAPLTLGSRWLRPAAAALTAAAIASGTAWFLTGNSAPFLLTIALEIAFSVPLRPRIITALHGADQAARDLDVLAVVLARIEQETLVAPRLMNLQRSLTRADERYGVAASASIHRLHWLVELHDWQHNAMFAALAATVLWGTHLALSIEAWRRAYGRHVREWLRVCGEFEALASLSAYRYEHPADPFPKLVDADERPPLFDAVRLGHPLIPAVRMVRNDVQLGGPIQLLVVSGSNMSGKSTLLRTVGVNAVLAFAGAPVRATRFRISPLRVGATLRIQDSLQEGRSRFFAEISRIREVADLAGGSTPVLFLLDELLHGTNSHDRAVGAAGVLRALVARGAIGLVTTHDLALTAIADDFSGHAANVHFDDRFESGTIAFDYVMKPGPVTRSNALALMRAVGLEVQESDG